MAPGAQYLLQSGALLATQVNDILLVHVFSLPKGLVREEEYIKPTYHLNRNKALARKPGTPPVVETLRKALAWRQELDSGVVANQADIARREGITRARVTQVLMLLRLAPDVQERVLAFPVTVDRPVLTERMLRPITFLEDAVRQQTTFSEMVAASSSR